MIAAVPICFMLERQAVCRAFSRAWANTGKRMAARMAIMAITTRSSIRVKALLEGSALYCLCLYHIDFPPERDDFRTVVRVVDGTDHRALQGAVEFRTTSCGAIRRQAVSTVSPSI